MYTAEPHLHVDGEGLSLSISPTLSSSVSGEVNVENAQSEHPSIMLLHDNAAA